MKLILETAWHHEGDVAFMNQLIERACTSSADIIKVHMLLDIDEYMMSDHSAYEVFKPWIFQKENYADIFKKIKAANKELMVLLNDTKSIEMAAQFSPSYIEIHSVCLNDNLLLDAISVHIDKKIPIVLGVGGSSVYEIEHAINHLDGRPIVLMFGFQNYPTRFEDVNLLKIRRVMSAFPECTFGYADHTGWDHPDNLLVTMMGAAQGVDLVEKHVTHVPGQNRTDYSAAIDFTSFEQLKKQLEILQAMQGDGLLQLNAAEQKYCVPGTMKKAGILNVAKKVDETLIWEDVAFKRTGQSTTSTQLDIWNYIGKKFVKNVSEGSVITPDMFFGE